MLRWLGHLGRMDPSRLARRLLWATLPGGVGASGGQTIQFLPNVYSDQLKILEPHLSAARRDWQSNRASQGESLFGFSWLCACADRDSWRKLIDKALAQK